MVRGGKYKDMYSPGFDAVDGKQLAEMQRADFVKRVNPGSTPGRQALAIVVYRMLSKLKGDSVSGV